jgi:hypothetical protein
MSARPNAELAYRVLDAINANPAHFDMDTWVRVPHDAPTIGLAQLTSPECGTTACFAGWAIVLSGYELTRDLEIVQAGRVVPEVLSRFAASLLGLNDEQADELFLAANEDFHPELVAEIFGPRPAGPAADEQAWRECAHRADYLTPAEHARECAYHRGEVEPVALDYDDVPPNAGSAS